MHSDLIELFVLYSTIPVIHLGEKSEKVDHLLKAGRISAQDVLGRETTGETITAEVLEDSYFVYKRHGNFLFALRAKSNISQYGAEKLLERVIHRVLLDQEKIKQRPGNTTYYKDVITDIDLILGEKIPTDPIIMGEITEILQDSIQKIDSIDLIAIVTQEAWVVQVVSKEEAMSHSPFLWKNMVDSVHQTLGKEVRSVFFEESGGIFIIVPVYLEKERWWIIAIRLTLNHQHHKVKKTQPKISLLTSFTLLSWKKELLEINNKLIIPVHELIKKMARRAERRIGLKGIFKDVIHFVDFSYPQIAEWNTVRSIPQSSSVKKKPSAAKYLKALEYPEFKKNSLFLEVRQEGKLVNLNSLKSISKEISEIFKTTLFPHTKYRQSLPQMKRILGTKYTVLTNFDENYVEYFSSLLEFLFLEDPHERTKLFLGFGEEKSFFEQSPRMTSIFKRKNDLLIYLGDMILESNPNEQNHMIEKNEEINFKQYRFTYLKRTGVRLLSLHYKNILGAFSGIITMHKNVTDIFENRLLAISNYITK